MAFGLSGIGSPGWDGALFGCAPAIVTAALGEIVGSWNTAQLEGLGHMFPDGHLESAHRFLGIEELTGDGIIQEALAQRLKSGDLVVIEWETELLPLLEAATLLVQFRQLIPKGGIGRETFDAGTNQLEVGQFQKDGTELLGFCEPDGVFRGGGHGMDEMGSGMDGPSAPGSGKTVTIGFGRASPIRSRRNLDPGGNEGSSGGHGFGDRGFRKADSIRFRLAHGLVPIQRD